MCYRVQPLSTLMEIMRMKPNTAITHQNKLTAYLLRDDTFHTSLPSPPTQFLVSSSKTYRNDTEEMSWGTKLLSYGSY